MTSRPWRPEDVSTLIAMWKAEIAIPDLAVALRRSAAAISSKVQRLREDGHDLAYRNPQLALVNNGYAMRKKQVKA